MNMDVQTKSSTSILMKETWIFLPRKIQRIFIYFFLVEKKVRFPTYQCFKLKTTVELQLKREWTK